MIKLGQVVTDTATGLKAMAIMQQMDIGGAVNVLLQPKRLNPKTNEPVDGLWVSRERLKDAEQDPTPYPVEVLNTIAEDEATGFKGTVIALIVHISGCVHLQIQAKGETEEGKQIPLHNFDIRRCKGPAIKPITPEARKADEAVRPSPCNSPQFVR